MEIFMRHSFPGGARELENAIEYGFVLCRNGMIDVHHLPEDLQARAHRAGSMDQSTPISPLQQNEASVLRSALSRHRGHRGRAAKELGISRTTLWRKMQKHGIRADDL
jgi:transcriptional regulator with PAS, ATPase and Fis domain